MFGPFLGKKKFSYSTFIGIMSEQLITISPGIVVIVLMNVLNRHQVLLEYVPLVKAVLPPNIDYGVIEIPSHK